MNPLLKQHIETYIDDIDRHNLITSIIYCPLDVMSEYLDTLRMIDEPIPGHLVPFTRISCYLASQFEGGHMYNMTMRGIGDETYTFDFPIPSSRIDVQQLNNGITNSCPCHYVHNDFSMDYAAQTVTIKVSITPAYSKSFF